MYGSRGNPTCADYQSLTHVYSPVPGLFVISIAVDAVAIGSNQRASISILERAGGDRLIDEFAERVYTIAWIILYIRENLRNCIPFHFLKEIKSAISSQIDGCHIGVAEQIVQVTQCFLIGPNKENAEIVRLAFLEGVHRQRR